MKTKHLVLSLLVTFFASHTAWASCSINLDMGGNKVTNVTMTHIETPSELATKSYVDFILQGEAGLMASPSSLKYASVSEAAEYCANLESPAINDSNEIVPGIVYNDWRIPSLEELVGLCLRQGSQIVYEHDKTLYEANNGEEEELLYSHEEFSSKWVANGICDYNYTTDKQVGEEQIMMDETSSVIIANNIKNVYDGYDLLLQSMSHPRHVKTLKYPVSVPANLNTGSVRLGQFAHATYIQELQQHALCVR